MSRPRGLFVTLEGPEGSGKSSQCQRLARALRRAGCRVTAIRDPGSTALGQALRRVLLHGGNHLSPLAEALLFIGGRVRLVDARIRPALRQGRVVICDRFHDATLAYQGFGGGLDVGWLDRLGRASIRGVMPALTILLDVPTERGFARLHRGRDRMERKARAFHRKVRRGYLRLARRAPHRFVVVDARQSPAEVHAKIKAIVSRRLKRIS